MSDHSDEETEQSPIRGMPGVTRLLNRKKFRGSDSTSEYIGTDTIPTDFPKLRFEKESETGEASIPPPPPPPQTQKPSKPPQSEIRPDGLLEIDLEQSVPSLELPVEQPKEPTLPPPPPRRKEEPAAAPEPIELDVSDTPSVPPAFAETTGPTPISIEIDAARIELPPPLPQDQNQDDSEGNESWIWHLENSAVTQTDLTSPPKFERWEKADLESSADSSKSLALAALGDGGVHSFVLERSKPGESEEYRSVGGFASPPLAKIWAGMRWLPNEFFEEIYTKIESETEPFVLTRSDEPLLFVALGVPREFGEITVHKSGQRLAFGLRAIEIVA